MNLCRAYDAYLAPLERWQSGARDTRSLFTALAAADARLTEASDLSVVWRHRILARALGPRPGRLLYRAFRVQAVGALIRGACALERYRLVNERYPDRLADLAPDFIAALPVDPMTARPLLYRRRGATGYVLYSVGSDFTDDGGNPGSTGRGEPVGDTGDWVWRR